MEKLLYGLGFPPQFIGWIMTCVSSAKFSIKSSGQLFRYFKSGRGLRQGDPILPLLFVIIMDYLACALSMACSQRDFRFHPGCKELKLCHLSFADDLLLFCKGNPASVKCLMGAFNHFSICSGLEANLDKSQFGCSRGFPTSMPFGCYGFPVGSSTIQVSWGPHQVL